MRTFAFGNDSDEWKPSNVPLSSSLDDLEDAWADDIASEDWLDWLPAAGMALGGLVAVCVVCATGWWIYSASLSGQVQHQLMGSNIEYLTTGAPVELAGVEVGTVGHAERVGA